MASLFIFLAVIKEINILNYKLGILKISYFGNVTAFLQDHLTHLVLLHNIPEKEIEFAIH